MDSTKRFLETRKGACLCLGLVLIFGGTGLRLILNYVENLGDIGMYIAIAQALDSGSVLYKDVIDTKNMGFLFFFYGLYKPYALLFPHMAYFIAYMNAILLAFYYTLSLMIYEVLRRICRPLTALWGGLFFIIYLPLVGNHLNFNQPQFALFTWLLLALFLSSKKLQGAGDYFIMGALLGLNVAGNSPYILLTLIVPFIVWRRGMSLRQYAFGLCSKGSAAFGGFLLALAPYFWYFYKHGALGDWWIWQVIYTSQVYTERDVTMALKNIPLWAVVLGGETTASRVLSSIPLIISFGGAGFFFKSWRQLREQRLLLFILALLSGLSRLIFLSNGFSWYVIYYLPLMVFVLSHWLEKLSSKRQVISFAAFWAFWAVAALWNPCLSFTPTEPLSWGYDRKAALITIKNPEKRPDVYVAARPAGFAYSTTWKYVYYNIYVYPDEKSSKTRDDDQILARHLPEACIMGPLGWGSFEEEKYPILAQRYTKVSESMYIRNDKVPEWDLSAGEGSLDNTKGFVSLGDILAFKKIQVP